MARTSLVAMATIVLLVMVSWARMALSWDSSSLLVYSERPAESF